MKLCEERVEGKRINGRLVSPIPIFDAMVLDAHNNRSDLFVGRDLLMEEVRFATIGEIAEDLCSNLTTGKYRWFGLILLLHRGEIGGGGEGGQHFKISVTVG